MEAPASCKTGHASETATHDAEPVCELHGLDVGRRKPWAELWILIDYDLSARPSGEEHGWPTERYSLASRLEDGAEAVTEAWFRTAVRQLGLISPAG